MDKEVQEALKDEFPFRGKVYSLKSKQNTFSVGGGEGGTLTVSASSPSRRSSTLLESVDKQLPLLDTAIEPYDMNNLENKLT